MNPCVLVNPGYPADRKSRHGIGLDPLVATITPAGLRQAAWAVSALTLSIALVWGASLPDNPDALPVFVALPITLLFFAGIFAPKLVKDTIANEQRVAFRCVDLPYELAQMLESMRCDAVRFRDMAASQPRTIMLAEETADSLAWLLWHTADRIDQIALLQAELGSAGSRTTGPAKQAWFRDREQRINELRAPILLAAVEVRSLADLAEDTVWAARLATEKFPTVEVAAPTAMEIGAEADIETAVEALASWHAAWMLLDERLRALTTKMDEGEGSG